MDFKMNIGINNIKVKFFEEYYDEEHHCMMPSYYAVNLNGANIESIVSNEKTIGELEILALNTCITHFSKQIEKLQRKQKLFIKRRLRI